MWIICVCVCCNVLLCTLTYRQRGGLTATFATVPTRSTRPESSRSACESSPALSVLIVGSTSITCRHVVFWTKYYRGACIITKSLVYFCSKRHMSEVIMVVRPALIKLWLTHPNSSPNSLSPSVWSREKNVMFREYLRRLETHKRCQHLSMQSFLLLPMQRITRLPLLILAILNKTPLDHPDHRIVENALRTIQKVSTGGAHALYVRVFASVIIYFLWARGPFVRVYMTPYKHAFTCTCCICISRNSTVHCTHSCEEICDFFL